MKKIIEQALRFVGLSGIGWILDFCVYALLGRVSGNLALNNVISSWVGVTFVFTFATRKVFVNNSRISLRWKYLIYIGYQAVLILCVSRLLQAVNSAIVSNVDIEWMTKHSAILAKIAITPVTMAINFIVMKCIIEKL